MSIVDFNCQRLAYLKILLGMYKLQMPYVTHEDHLCWPNGFINMLH